MAMLLERVTVGRQTDRQTRATRDRAIESDEGRAPNMRSSRIPEGVLWTDLGGQVWVTRFRKLKPRRINTLAPDTTRDAASATRAGRLTESMLALLVNSLGFTPGLGPAHSARSSIESPVAMRVDLEGVSMEEYASTRARFPEVAEALESLVSELQEINKIDEQNIQKLVSCPEPAPPSASATRPLPAVSPQLSPKLWHLQDEMIAREKDFAEYIDAQFKFLKRSLLEL